MRNTVTNFPQSIDDRLFMNECSLEYIDLYKKYQEYIACADYTAAAQLLENSDVNIEYWGAWLFNLLGNQCHAIGEYLKHENGYESSGDNSWSVSDKYSNVATPKAIIESNLVNAVSKNDTTFACGGKRYLKSAVESKTNQPFWNSDYKYACDSSYYVDSDGTQYTKDTYGDRVYYDDDNNVCFYTDYLQDTPMKYYKDENNNPYGYYEDGTKYWLYYDLYTKFMYSQEPSGSLKYKYLADDYKNKGIKHWYFGDTFEDEKEEWLLQDGDPRDTAPSSNEKSYFYYQIEDETDRMRLATGEYITYDGILYYSSNEILWTYNSDKQLYQEIKVVKNVITEYLNRYCANLGSTLLFYLTPINGYRYTLEADTNNWIFTESNKYDVNITHYIDKTEEYIYIINPSDNVVWKFDLDTKIYTNDAGETSSDPTSSSSKSDETS